MTSLQAQLRPSGRKRLKQLRAKGILPAILYGPKLKKSVPVAVAQKDFERLFRQAGESTIIELVIGQDQGAQKYPVFIHELQRHAVSGRIFHVDFYQVDLKKRTQVVVPLVFTGTAPAVALLNGILQRIHREVTVEGLPMNIPHQLAVDLAKLKTFDDQILVSDIRLPEGATIVGLDSGDLVASVLEPRTDEELASLEETVEEKVEAVEEAGRQPAKEEAAAEAEKETAGGGPGAGGADGTKQ